MASLFQRELLDGEDSLFGSPPPSPGRSPLPTLALPGSTCSGIGLSATQNVGTIALPGSHHFSELPLNPLALPSSLQQAPRPPAHSNVSQRPVYNHVFHAAAGSTSSSPASSRSSSQGPPLRSKKKVMKAKSTTLRPPGPEIALPDPSTPPPAHFLRNQTALLGMAGLVGGIKPSNLSMPRHMRGATSSNPIVIEDADDTPTLGRTSGFRQPYQQAIDPALLPAPSNQDIVSMLIRQKNIFPVLESILKLIAAGSQDQPQGFRRRTTSQQPREQTPVSHPVKKRKLNRVPAGATDWDVPYPFEQGEGPDAYQSTWERERGKQLISQLISLIKTAARKAATKKYLKSQETTKRGSAETGEKRLAATYPERSDGSEEVRVHGYYKPETAVYGLDQRATTQQSEVLIDASNGRKETQSAAVGVTQLSRPLTLPETQPQTPFDQFISSLLAASTSQVSSSHVSPISTNAPPDLPLEASGNTESLTVQSRNEGDDQVLFDSWMNALQTLPVPSGGFSQSQHPSSSDGPPLHSSDDFGFFDPTIPCFDWNGTFEEGSLSSIMKGIGSSGMSINDNVGQPTVFADILHSAEQDCLIDPELLAVSKPNNEQRSEESLQVSLAPSPIPSMSSPGDSDPKTPTSSGWDITLPGIYVDGSAMLEDSLRLNEAYQGRQGMLQRAFGNNHRDHFRELPDNNESNVSGDLTFFNGAVGVDKGKGREVVPSAVALSSSTVFDAQEAAFRALLAEQGSEPYLQVPSSSQASKEEVLRRGHERKRRLEEELQRVRLQLWETTVEQAALSHLAVNT